MKKPIDKMFRNQRENEQYAADEVQAVMLDRSPLKARHFGYPVILILSAVDQPQIH
jgi:hypothetical protein